ncbi:uncharacterized protein LOC135483943 [Lineus longissimus]|uniref:uncharacterized protein LOC135483943 n=1 Tax=Lineus longissimus TaxID=88925 RepID=UPI00315CFE49
MTCCSPKGCYSEDSIEKPWSWVVLVAGFGLFLIFSVVLTPAIYYLSFYEVFGSSKLVTSWIGSLTVFSMMSIGPVSSILTNRFGCRIVMITGILLTSVGLILTMFATSVYYTYLTFGCLMGVGLGLVYTPTAAMISLNFDKHRTLALGLGASGIAVGMLVYPLITRALIHHYGWRGSLLLLGGIYLNALPLSLLIQPIDNTDKKTHHMKQEKWSIKIFSEKRYVFLCLGYLLITGCMATVFFFLPSYAVSLGEDNDTASVLISYMGVASLVGRIFYSFLGHHKKVDVMMVFSITFFFSSVITLMSPLFTSFTALAIYGPAYTFFAAPHTGYMTDQVISTIGIKQLVSGIGFMMLFAGIGNITGPPLAGLVVDITGEYSSAFLFVGAMDMAGVAFLVASWPRWYKGCQHASDSFSIPEERADKVEQQSCMLPAVEDKKSNKEACEEDVNHVEDVVTKPTMPCKKFGKCYADDSVETPWSYVVLTAGFFVFVLIAIIYIPSVYYITFYEVFDVGKGTVSWVGSLMAFCMKFIGPVSSALTNRFGGRPVMITGTFLTSIGLITSMFAESVFHMYGTLGVLCGLGLGLLFAPTSAMIGLYFDKHRTLAIGLSATGVGMGMFIYPPLVRWLIHEFGWRGSFLILGGIYLNAIPLTLLIQPIAETPDDHPTHPKHVKRLGWSFHLLKRREFLCLCFGYFTTMFFATTVFHHLPSYAYTLGVPADQASMLLSAVGIASIVGRLFFSFCGQHPRVSVSIAYTIAFICAGILTFICPMLHSFVALLVYGPAFGFFVSPITGYMTDQVIATVGVQHLVAGIGYVMAFAGCGILIGPPSAGWLFDRTQNYVYSFLMAGCVNVIGVLCLFGTWPCLRHRPFLLCNLHHSDEEMNGQPNHHDSPMKRERNSEESTDSEERQEMLHKNVTKTSLVSNDSAADMNDT